MLLQAALQPALLLGASRAPTPAALAVTCCADACACEIACPCAASDDTKLPQRDSTPATPPRGGGDESLRHLTLVGARVIDCLPPAARVSTPIVIDWSRSLPPAAFRGATAQASLCVRTT